VSIGIQLLGREDIAPAMALVWRVFSEFEAPEYSAEGVDTFRAFIEPEAINHMKDAGELRLWGAFAGGELRGVLALRGEAHISLFFVEKEYHRQGIGRALWECCAQACRAAGAERVTVNSSPYAVTVYRRLGFAETAIGQTQNGIRYVPMEFSLF
jgi:GNAT superfamily N-acetyltransferase